jgi:hypothetical protein
LPVIIPLLVCFGLLIFRGISSGADITNFALLWLIPVGALRALGWSSLHDPILLVIVPMLWTALAIGIPYLIKWMTDNYNPFFTVIAVLCIIVLPVSASAAYWAFFSQRALIGFGLLLAANVPFAFSFVFGKK